MKKFTFILKFPQSGHQHNDSSFHFLHLVFLT